MKEISNRLIEHGNLTIELSREAKEWLATEGFDQDFGARPLKRALQRYVESPLSVSMLKGDFIAGDKVLGVPKTDGDKVGLTFTRVDEDDIDEDAPQQEETVAA